MVRSQTAANEKQSALQAIRKQQKRAPGPDVLHSVLMAVLDD